MAEPMPARDDERGQTGLERVMANLEQRLRSSAENAAALAATVDDLKTAGTRAGTMVTELKERVNALAEGLASEQRSVADAEGRLLELTVQLTELRQALVELAEPLVGRLDDRAASSSDAADDTVGVLVTAEADYVSVGELTDTDAAQEEAMDEADAAVPRNGRATLI